MSTLINMNENQNDVKNEKFKLETSKIIPTIKPIKSSIKTQENQTLFGCFEKHNEYFKNHFFFKNLNDDGFFIDGNICDNFFDYYKNVADSGVGLIATGGFYVGADKCNNSHAVINNDKIIKQKMKNLTTYIHSRGSKIFMTLKSIGGRFDSNNKFLNIFSKSASFNVDYFDTRKYTARISDGELNRIVNEFSVYASLAGEFGFDGLILDFGLENLMGEMISEEFNRRSFGYYSNQMDFAEKVINNIKLINKNLIIYVNYFYDSFFSDIYEKTQKHIKTIKNYANFHKNINKFAIFDEFTRLGINGFLFEFGSKETEFLSDNPPFVNDEFFVDFYFKLSKHISCYIKEMKINRDIVIIYSNQFTSLNNVIRLVKNKVVDFVDVTKNLYADNNYLKNTKTQNIVNPCIKCSHCNNISSNFNIIECAINPNTFNKSMLKKVNSKNNIKVAVVGAGVSGIVCSLILAERGYEVYLYDSQNKINSTGIIETVFDFDIHRKLFNNYLSTKLDEFVKMKKIFVKLKTPFNISDNNHEYYSIIVATGFHEKFLQVQGAVLKNVKSLYDALSDKNNLLSYKRIVINARSELSLKLALFLLLNKKRVTVLISDITHFFKLPNSHYCYYFYSLKQLGAEVFINSRLKKIEDDFVDVVVDSKLYSKDYLALALNLKNTKYSKGEKREVSVDADLVIYEPELSSNNKLYYDLVSKIYPGELYMVGSAFQIGDIASDIKSAYFVAKNL